MNDTDTPSGEAPILTLINEIKSKKVPPESLSVEDRRRCVEVLRAEGYTIAEIGQILRRNERTIRRDLREIRAGHALCPDPLFAERFIGNFINEAEICYARLRRIARESQASAMERLMAETSAWKVLRELLEKLQSVGHLPRMPTGVVAEIHQRIGVDPVASYEALARRLGEIERLDKEAGEDDPQKAARHRMLFDEVERGRMAARIEGLKSERPEMKEGPGDERG